MAAPVISGAAAVLQGAWPHLTAQNVVRILLDTATDLGDAGVDNIYGHGLVNLEAAVDQQGDPVTTLSLSSIHLQWVYHSTQQDQIPKPYPVQEVG